MKRLIWLSIIVLFICGCHRHISMDKVRYDKFYPQPYDYKMTLEGQKKQEELGIKDTYAPHLLQNGKPFQKEKITFLDSFPPEFCKPEYYDKSLQIKFP